MDIIIIGLLLGGTYALMAMGLQLQYGVARIMNLGQWRNADCRGIRYLLVFYRVQNEPALCAVRRGAAGVCRELGDLSRTDFLPLVKRAKSQGQLEVDSILATFGLSFICVGLLLAVIGGDYVSYSYLARPFIILGEPYGLNRIVAFLGSSALCIGLYVWLHWTRTGLAFRAVAVNPSAARLVSINVARTSALAFALGGAVTAAGGTLLSMFLTFDASLGVIFTLKALVIVVMGGVSDIRGAIVAAFILGFAETAVATLVDPGLTLAAAYLLFITILLVRPEGLFGRRSS